MPHAGRASGDDDRFFLFFCFYARARCLHSKADASRLHSARLPMHLYLTVTVFRENKNKNEKIKNKNKGRKNSQATASVCKELGP